mgnify:CR=1 FL=1
MYKSDFEIKKELCEIGRRIYNDGFVAANEVTSQSKLMTTLTMLHRQA